GGSAAVKQLKFTVGYSDIPEVVHFYHEQQFTSENRALKDTILDHATADNLSTIRVFDRGITARNTYDKMTSQDIFFVSRLNNSAKKEKISSNEKITSSAPVKASSVTIISDEWCYLFSSEERSKYPIRRIEAYRNDTGEKLVFISNIKESTAQEITEIYKKRWDIEVFFKFLKHVLNFNHLINRNENGIKVMLYVTMIAAILLQAYKKANKLTGFKIPLQELEQELDKEVTRNIVMLWGGSTDTFDILFGSNSP
ncbi:MAG: transposase, partial [Chitinophagaceae bacterium]|nr:transposase [Chitinophagaceae bacterium]